MTSLTRAGRTHRTERPAARAGLALAVFALALSTPAAGWAGSVVAKTFSELVMEADTIVLARIGAAHARRLPGGLIVTDYQLEAPEILRAGARPVSALTLPGGVIGDEGLQVSGVPQPEIGGRYLIFLGPNPRAMVPTVGADQGLLRVVADPASGTEFLHDARGEPLNPELVAQVAGAAGSSDGGARLPLRVAILAIERILAR